MIDAKDQRKIKTFVQKVTVYMKHTKHKKKSNMQTNQPLRVPSP